MAQIALDAMGGDLAPTETVAGALAAAGEGVEVLLVGDEIRLKAELADQGGDLPIVHAPDEVGMGEDAARALRQKPNSSISVCARLVHDGEAKAFVSAGSTGAAMAAAAIIIGRLPGVLRPTIASIFPTPGTPTVVLDSGANPEVKAQHLVQFALMGSAMAEVYLGMENPRVGLLNIGEEPGKGRGLDKQAFALLRATSLNFVGNVEGRDLAANRTDVIVTDGFTGNVFLKTTEGAAQWVTLLTLEAIVKLDPDVRVKVLPVLGDIRRDMDYEHHGGGHLLGVDGVVVIAHGSSTRVAIANSLAIARDGVDRKLVSRVAERIVKR
jgi:glycerol-3-phosphate acyltransferase PlsX